MAKHTGYSVALHGELIADRGCMTPYAEALKAAVRPGCTVLDIGAGTGIFSLLACQYGAGKVHAVEPDDVIEVARSIAAANGYTERITFYQALSTDVTLPAPVDVIVSDLRGVLPLFQHHIPSIIDARRRFLAPGGVLIPRCDTLWGAVVENPRLYRCTAEPWLVNDFGLDMRAGHRFAVNKRGKTHVGVEQLLVPPQKWATLDYASIESPDVAGQLAWTVESAGTAHALLLWFDTELTEGIGFSNAPGEQELVYRQACFPLQQPVDLEPGDRIEVRLRADLIGDDYIWQWRTRVITAGDAPRVKASFHQSTFFGRPLSLDHMRKREAGYRPALSDDALVERMVLSLMDGETTLGEIARNALEAFPARFANYHEALACVGDLSLKHSRSFDDAACVPGKSPALTD